MDSKDKGIDVFKFHGKNPGSKKNKKSKKENFEEKISVFRGKGLFCMVIGNEK